MICILIFGKTTTIPTPSATTGNEESTTKQDQTTTTTTTEYTRATTEAQEFKNTGSIIVQGTRAMEILVRTNLAFRDMQATLTLSQRRFQK